MEKNKLVHVIVILFIIGGLVIIHYGKKKETRRRNFLKNEGEFSIGVFGYRTFDNGTLHSVTFSYVVMGEKYKRSDMFCYYDSSKASDAFDDKRLAKEDDKFLVLYDKKNPKEAIIRLDYPIKDSADFKRYVKKFEQMRK